MHRTREGQARATHGARGLVHVTDVTSATRKSKPTHCSQCGNPIVQREGVGRPYELCSDACRRERSAMFARVHRWLAAGAKVPEVPNSVNGKRRWLSRAEALNADISAAVNFWGNRPVKHRAPSIDAWVDLNVGHQRLVERIAEVRRDLAANDESADLERAAS